MALLQDVTAMTHEQLVAKIMQMQASSQRKLTLKISNKGAVSMYGLGRFPVTLYRTQWERLIGEVEHIKGFIEANANLLATKN